MSFKVGDLCIGQNPRWNSKYDGMECVVVGELKYRRWISQYDKVGEGFAYEVQWSNGDITSALPDQLRLKKPPAPERQQLGEWELCPWKPASAQTV